MNIHFLGGSDEVGASCLLIEIGGQKILVDAGVRVSPKVRDGLSGEMLPDLSVLSEITLDAVIVTHAHADHIGAIPLVLGSKPGTPIYATQMTIDLMKVMLQDALRIMDAKSEQEGELPHYDQVQVEHLEKSLKPALLRQEFFIKDTVRVQFFRAGHIPGAVSVFLESSDGSILVSGDLSFSPMRATPKAEIPPVRPDVLILETTYGGRLHANRKAEERRLIEAVTQIVAQGGRVLIPAFALGRAQEVALILDAAIAKKEMPTVPVYLDGMTRSITSVFERHPEYLDQELGKYVEANRSLWRSSAIKFVKQKVERNSIIHSSEPCVIVASSGMLTGGASPLYAAQLVKEKQSAIFITGYQDEESPGKALQSLASAGGGVLQLEGKKYQVECKIATYSLSAHADENELTQYATQLEPDHLYLVHGDGEARTRMAGLIRERQLRVHLPKLGEVVSPKIKPDAKRKFVQVKGIGAGTPLTDKNLWDALIAQDMAKAQLTIEDLALFWYGDRQIGLPEIQQVINPLYFAQDWRDKSLYQIRTPNYVEQYAVRIAWLQKHQPIEGKLVLLHNNQNRLYLGIGRGSKDIEIMVTNGKTPLITTQAERLIAVVEPWRDPLPADSDEAGWQALAKALEVREMMISQQAAATLTLGQVASLMDGVLRNVTDVMAQFQIPADQLIPLLWRLGDFKAKLFCGMATLYPRTGGKQLEMAEKLDFASARVLVQQLFPVDARLRKISEDKTANSIVLRFDFPLVAQERYGELTQQASALTGWKVEIHPSQNNLAFEEVARALLPGLMAAPSIHLAQQAVEVKPDAIPANFEEIQALFKAQTGFQLMVKGSAQPAAAVVAAPTVAPLVHPVRNKIRLEINAAYALLKGALDKHGMYKLGLKDNSMIVLYFITPEVGYRHVNLMQELAEQVGYTLTFHMQPNQNELINRIKALCQQYGVALKKTPSLQIDQRRVQIEPTAAVNSAVCEKITAAFLEDTGYHLAIKG